MQVPFRSTGVSVLVAIVLAMPPATGAAQIGAAAANQPLVMKRMTTMPLAFTENKGQWDERVLFQARTPGMTIWFTKDGVTYHSIRRIETAARMAFLRSGFSDAMSFRQPDGQMADSVEEQVIRSSFEDANPEPSVVGEGLTEYRCNYFLGNAPAKWRTDVPSYDRIVYRDLYPGIDLAFYGKDGTIEYDFIVHPEGDPSAIALRYDGVRSPSIDRDGNLILATPWGELVHRVPQLYEVLADGERVPASGGFCVSEDGLIRFDLAESIHPAMVVVIDPVLEYSTYLGGDYRDAGYSIAVDASGSAYVTGWTSSIYFPLKNAFDSTTGVYGMNYREAFVTKFATTGNSLVYSTYLGGTYDDIGSGIAVDTSGSAYVTGFTYSEDFPTQSPYDSTADGYYWDAFVTRLSPAGNALVYSTYLGGARSDYGLGIAVDTSASAYVTGSTYSTDFPMQDPYDPSYNGGSNDAFVSKFSPAGDALAYSTFLGGSGVEDGRGIVVDAFGNAIVTGSTQSTNFPTHNALYPSGSAAPNADDAFLTKLSTGGNALLYSTYLGGTAYDAGTAVALDVSGNAYVTGMTSSTDFPVQNPFSGNFNGGPYDVFVTKISPTGDALVYSTYVGGADGDVGGAISVGASGSAHISGFTTSFNFPVLNSFDATYNGGQDAFVTKLSPAGNALMYSTYLGGGSTDAGQGIAVDGSDNAYLTGYTNSTDFPTVGPYQTFQGEPDVVVAKLSPKNPPQARCHNVVAHADGDCQATVLPSAVNNGSWDAEDGTNLTLTLVPEGPYGLGANNVQLIVTDTQGLKDTCNAVITVVDVTRPIVNCPDDITVNSAQSQCGAAVAFSLSASDDCPGALTVSSIPASGSFFPAGTTVVTGIAADAAGNKDTCYFNVTVTDTEQPVANCPGNIDTSVGPGQPGSVVAFVSSATDNCPGAIIACNPASGSFFPVGVTEVRCIATDASGNRDTCMFLVTVAVRCSCPKQGDINGDGVIDVFDVIGLIDIVFHGSTDLQDPWCPNTRGDVDNNGVTDVFDVIYLIATAFSGGPNPVDPCVP